MARAETRLDARTSDRVRWVPQSSLCRAALPSSELYFGRNAWPKEQKFQSEV